MKSARNPLMKKLPPIRRVKRSSKNTNAISEMDMEAQYDTAVGEQSPTTHSDIQPADGQCADEVDACVPQDCQEVVLFSNSKVDSSFQSEFLKMLSRPKSKMPVEWNCRPKRLKPDSRSVLKSKLKRHPLTLKKLARKAARKVAKSYGFSLPASNICTKTSSEQTAADTEGYLEGGVKSVTDSNSSHAETSSLNCSIATPAAVAQPNSELISSDKQQTAYVTVDVLPSLEKAYCSLFAAKTSASCEAVERFDSKSLVEDKTCHITQSDVSPPVLSLPDPVNDIGISPQHLRSESPPVLEPSYHVSDDYLSAGAEAVSEAVSAHDSVTSSVHERRTLLKSLTSTGSGLQNNQQCSAATSSTKVMDIADSSVVTSVSCSFNSPTTCSASLEASSSSTPPISTATANAQLPCAANSCTADRKPMRSSNFSALARFRPTLPASSLLPPVNVVRRHVPPCARPELSQNPRTNNATSLVRR